MTNYSNGKDAAMPEVLECLDRHAGACSGAVEYRHALSATGQSFPRCDGHWSARVTQEDEHRRNYPDSPVAPAWFDPADAGETWDEN